jgi:phosphate transport system protein
MNHLRNELQELRNELLTMGRLVESSIRLSVDAVIHRDKDAIKTVFHNESIINHMELRIDEIAFQLLALQHPVAVDLRFIMMAMKINNNLERMGDIAQNITHYALELLEMSKPAPRVDIPHMAQLAQEMIQNSLDAFVRWDVELARKVLRSDDEVDTLRDRMYSEIRKYIEEDSSRVNPGLEYIFIARGLERLADHATNIAEDVLFFVQGIDVRHNAIAGDR